MAKIPIGTMRTKPSGNSTKTSNTPTSPKASFTIPKLSLNKTLIIRKAIANKKTKYNMMVTPFHICLMYVYSYFLIDYDMSI